MPQVQRQREPAGTCFSLPMQLLGRDGSSSCPCLLLGLLQLYWQLQHPRGCLTSLLTRVFLGCCGPSASRTQQGAVSHRDGVIRGQGLCCVVCGHVPSGLGTAEASA